MTDEEGRCATNRIHDAAETLCDALLDEGLFVGASQWIIKKRTICTCCGHPYNEQWERGERERKSKPKKKRKPDVEIKVNWKAVVASEEGVQQLAILEFAKQYRTWRPGEFKTCDRRSLTRFRQAARIEVEMQCKNNVCGNFKTRTCKWIRHSLGPDFREMEGKLRWKTVEKIYEVAWADPADYDRCFGELQQIEVDLKQAEDLKTRTDHEVKEATEEGVRRDLVKLKRRQEQANVALVQQDDLKAAAFGLLELWDRSIQLIAEMRQIKSACLIPLPNKTNLEKGWFRFLPWLWKVLRDFESWLPDRNQQLSRQEKKSLKGIRLFNLIPQPSRRPHYIHLNQTLIKVGAKQVVAAKIKTAKNKEEKQKMMKANREAQKVIGVEADLARWSLFFNMSEVAKMLKSVPFGMSMKTNGYAISIMRSKQVLIPEARKSRPTKMEMG